MTSDTVSVHAFQSVAVLHQLTIEACKSETERELFHRIANESIHLIPYDRAVVVRFRDRQTPEIVSVSGIDTPDQQSSFLPRWQRLAAAISDPRMCCILDGGNLVNEAHEDWETLRNQFKGLSVCWSPIICADDLYAGAWFERWGKSAAWEEKERKLAESLCEGYAGACRIFREKPLFRFIQWWRRRRGRSRAILLLALLLMLLLPVRLRIVAPCEVIPEDPLLIAAPLDGVIESVRAKPNSLVEKGDILFSYDKQVFLKELDVAEQQVRIIEADLRRTRLESLETPALRAQLALLDHRMEQEKIRHRLAQENVEKLEVRAPRAGLAVIDDPYAWRGRPVRIGERVMTLVDPERTKLRIWLPENDNIDFTEDKTVQTYLNIDPATSREATLDLVALYAQTAPNGVPAFRAEAQWRRPAGNLKIGLKGNAVIFGKRVPLGYWLLRKPWTRLRAAIGY